MYSAAVLLAHCLVPAGRPTSESVVRRPMMKARYKAYPATRAIRAAAFSDYRNTWLAADLFSVNGEDKATQARGLRMQAPGVRSHKGMIFTPAIIRYGKGRCDGAMSLVREIGLNRRRRAQARSPTM